MGPGPGDPTDLAHPKIAHLSGTLRRLLAERRPFLAVCLSHQVLSALLGLELVRRPVPSQGEQREIDLFGEPHRVGFYNTFAARGEPASTAHLELSRDPATGEIHAIRGPSFASIQFHAESVLTQDGVRILGGLLTSALGGQVAGQDRQPA